MYTQATEACATLPRVRAILSEVFEAGRNKGKKAYKTHTDQSKITY